MRSPYGQGKRPGGIEPSPSTIGYATYAVKLDAAYRRAHPEWTPGMRKEAVESDLRDAYEKNGPV